jgi:hypothetical protein
MVEERVCPAGPNTASYKGQPANIQITGEICRIAEAPAYRKPPQ